MKKFIKFPEIEQFRNIIKDVQHSYQFQGLDDNKEPIFDRNAEMPILEFRGTVKSHGTHGGINWDGENIWAQKRTDICTIQHDNQGFAFFVESRKKEILKFFETVGDELELPGDIITLFGEFCGRNIQKGVAISQLEKMFIIFDAKITSKNDIDNKVEGRWLQEDLWKHIQDNKNKIYNIFQFENWKLDIDFNNPQLVQNDIIRITNKIEECCPIGNFFGIKGIGEGVVFSNITEKLGKIRFKSKGELHSISKVKTLASVDVEKLKTINNFADYSVTENRLTQGIEQIFTSNNIEPDIKKLGDFIRWIISDINKEELDVLAENGLEPKETNRVCSDRCRHWFLLKYQ